MQLMSDAITVLGSRHGLGIDPIGRGATLVRSEVYGRIRCEIHAGVVVDGRTVVLPLTGEGERFAFCDQDMTPTSMKLTGIDPQTRLKVELTVTGPFRPRDGEFSTTPVLDLKLRAWRMANNFRWTNARPIERPVELFLQITSDRFAPEAVASDELRFGFDSRRPVHRTRTDTKSPAAQADAWVVHEGTATDGRVVAALDASMDEQAAEIRVSWCAYSEPMLDVYGEPAPFKYGERFSNLDDVVAWARAHSDAVGDSAAKVDAIFAANNLGPAINHLTAQTIHSYLANTWWAVVDGLDWFCVWEGSCHYHSTVDVEYTQTPFYMTVWPELLAMELDLWPRFVIGGDQILGDRGKGTVVFMHDFGWGTDSNTTQYNHPMPVEENTNYVLMSYAYWRRSGDLTRARAHAEVIEQALEFVARCDTTGNGVPNEGMANTIDDASPAVQYGREQVYLAVKAMAALDVGAEMLAAAGRVDRCEAFRAQAAKIRDVIAAKGWLGDHFATLLDPGAEGVKDAWTGKPVAGDRVPGWDAAHIYTANGLALLDMIGRSVGMDDGRLRTDLIVAAERCLDKNGCRHSDYTPTAAELSAGEGGTVHTRRIGWVSMNMLRDISALYRGVDLRRLAQRYWEYQVVTNTQGEHLFFETFSGNNLMTYPRGVAVLGYFDALGGVRLDMVDKTISAAPLNDSVRVPVLLLADWRTGDVPVVANGSLRDPADLIVRAGLKG